MILLLTAALLAEAPAAGQATCATTAPVPGFAAGQALMATALAPGQPVELQLKPAEAVPFAPPLARSPAPGSYGGAFPLTIKAAGNYRIQLGGTAWIDVVRDGAALAPSAHAHGAPCSGVAKAVTFALEPGTYTVQLSELEARAITVKVTREMVLPAGK